MLEGPAATADDEAEGEAVSVVGGVFVQCRKRDEVREVTMAAEDPSPVLWTFRIVQLRGAKGSGVFSCSARSRSDCQCRFPPQEHDAREWGSRRTDLDCV